MKGFTLVEVLLAASVTLVAGTLLFSILVNSSGVFYKQTSIVSEGLNLNNALSEIDETIRQAASVATGYPEGSPEFISGGELLVLKLPATDSSGVIQNTYDFAVIVRDGSNSNVLRLQVYPDTQSSRASANTVLTTVLESVQFAYFDKNGNSVSPASAASVETTLTVLSKTGSIGSSQSSKILTTLRNTGG